LNIGPQHFNRLVVWWTLWNITSNSLSVSSLRGLWPTTRVDRVILLLLLLFVAGSGVGGQVLEETSAVCYDGVHEMASVLQREMSVRRLSRPSRWGRALMLIIPDNSVSVLKGCSTLYATLIRANTEKNCWWEIYVTWCEYVLWWTVALIRFWWRWSFIIHWEGECISLRGGGSRQICAFIGCSLISYWFVSK